MSRFTECLAWLLQPQIEGGWSDRPNDRGGPTMRGITQRTYDDYRLKLSLPLQSVKFISDEELQEIYKTGYWDPTHCDQCSVPLDLVMLDAAVQHGIQRALKCLQAALEVTADGYWGPETAAAVAATDPKALAQQVIAVRRKFYDAIVARDKTQVANYHGWMNRLGYLQEALA